MKATLTFDLPDENTEFKLAINGHNYYSVLWNVDQKLRGLIKHGDITDEQYKIYDNIRDMIRVEMEKDGLFFE